MDTALCCPNPLFRTEGLISSADGKNCPLLKRTFLLKFHAFEIRIKMAQVPHPNSEQLERAIPAPGLSSVQSARTELWLHCQPDFLCYLAAFSSPQVVWSWGLCLAHTNLCLSVCFLEKRRNIPSWSPPTRIFETERIFLSFSWAACPQLLLLVLCFSLSPLTLLWATFWTMLLLSPSRCSSRAFHVGWAPHPLYYLIFIPCNSHPHQATRIYRNYWSIVGNWKLEFLLYSLFSNPCLSLPLPPNTHSAISISIFRHS